jgi:hypothetical protein
LTWIRSSRIDSLRHRDCLRSGCNPLGEEPTNPSGVRFETALCRAILGGYLPEAKCFLTPADYEYLYDGLRVLAFEMGLRFFTDYVEGDVYFKVRDARHNLLRALVQFKLLASIGITRRTSARSFAI